MFIHTGEHTWEMAVTPWLLSNSFLNTRDDKAVKKCLMAMGHEDKGVFKFPVLQNFGGRN